MPFSPEFRHVYLGLRLIDVLINGVTNFKAAVIKSILISDVWRCLFNIFMYIRSWLSAFFEAESICIAKLCNGMKMLFLCMIAMLCVVFFVIMNLLSNYDSILEMLL